MEQVRTKLTAARSYTASMLIRVDLEFLQVPDTKAKLYFKAPDKTHIDAPGFAMIPRQGADLSAAKLLSMPYSVVDAGTESFHGTVMRKVKVIPTEDTSPVAVATVYIDTVLMVPRKVVTTAKRGGTYVAELVYDNGTARAVGLPSYVKLIFDIGNFEMPRTMSGDFDSKREEGKKNGQQKAVVEIWYSDYKINVPVADSIFK
jgi:hypothetical protein